MKDISELQKSRQDCVSALQEAESYANNLEVMKMQHISLSRVDREFHRFPKLRKEFSLRYAEISRLGYTWATQKSLEKAKILMDNDEWNDADITLRAIMNVYLPKSGLDVDEVTRETNKIWDSYNYRHKTSDFFSTN